MGIVGLDSLMNDIVQTYKSGTDDITKQAMVAAKNRATECRDNIRNDSPSDSNDYAKGWTVRKTKDGYVVYNRKKANIEMPLEHGHVITRGEHKGERTKAYPHIYDNADKARDDFVNDCIKIVKKGGRS